MTENSKQQTVVSNQQSAISKQNFGFRIADLEFRNSQFAIPNSQFSWTADLLSPVYCLLGGKGSTLLGKITQAKACGYSLLPTPYPLLEGFNDSPTGAGTGINMTGVIFTITLSDGTVVTFTP